MGVVTVTAPKEEPLAEKSAVSELALFQGENGPEVEDPQWLPVSQVPVPPTVVPLADQNSTVACTEEAARAKTTRAMGSQWTAGWRVRSAESGWWLGFINSRTERLRAGGKVGGALRRQHGFESLMLNIRGNYPRERAGALLRNCELAWGRLSLTALSLPTSFPNLH